MISIQKAIDTIQGVLRNKCSPTAEEPVLQLMPEEVDTLMTLFSKALNELPQEDTTKKPKKSPKDRKRARSAYQIWKSDPQVKTSFREAHPDLKGSKEINKAMGDAWKALTDEEKSTFTQAALDEKTAWLEAHPEAAKTTTPKSDSSPKSESSPKSRKRARTPYEIFKSDPQTKVRLNLEEGATYPQICKATKELWEDLSEEERCPFVDKAAEDAAHFQVESKTREVVAGALNTGLQLAIANSPSTSDSTSESPAPKRKRGPSAYQKWKKDPATKTAVAERFPDVTGKELTKHFKEVWNEMTVEDQSAWA